MNKTVRALALCTVAAAHTTCMKANWNEDEALQLVDGFFRENRGMSFEIHQQLCMLVKWMCEATEDTTHEEMIESLLNSLAEEIEK